MILQVWGALFHCAAAFSLTCETLSPSRQTQFPSWACAIRSVRTIAVARLLPSIFHEFEYASAEQDSNTVNLLSKVGFEDAPGGGAILYLDLPVWDDTVGGEIDMAAVASPSRVLFCGKIRPSRRRCECNHRRQA